MPVQYAFQPFCIGGKPYWSYGARTKNVSLEKMYPDFPATSGGALPVSGAAGLLVLTSKTTGRPGEPIRCFVAKCHRVPAAIRGPLFCSNLDTSVTGP